ncbi:MAG: SCO family protein [Thermodesulfobacteriota bacterium]
MCALPSLVAVLLATAGPVVAADDAPFAAPPGRAALQPGDETFGMTAGDRPAALRDVAFDQRLDEQVPRDVRLRDESGREVRLGDYLTDKPVILSLAYFSCPMLCPLHQQGLASSLKPLGFGAGRDFTVLTVSFDPRDTPEVAREKKREVLERYGRDGAVHGWHFLTGDAAELERLTRAVGFRYQYDEKRGEYAHPSGIVLLTADGRVSRYLFGIEFSPRDLRLGLVETAERKIGSVVDQALLFCFHYDPAMGRYSAVALNAVRIGGALTVLAMVVLIGGALLRETSRRRAARHGISA